MALAGFVVHYKGEFDTGAFIPAGGSHLTTKAAMENARRGAIVIVTPVTEIPAWVEGEDR
jgi:hypothetical protein